LAEKLLKIRISSGKSQAEISKLAGVSQRTWSSYERGETTPKMGILWGLAAKGYPIEGLTTGLIDDIASGEKVSKAELQKRFALARAMAEKEPLDTPVDDAWAERVDREYKRPLGKDTLKVYGQSDFPEGSFVVPLLNQRLSAGDGSYLPEEDEACALIRVPQYLARYGSQIAALTVDGDSMYPTLSRGDMVVCDSYGWSGEGIYALRMGGEGFVKRLTKAPGKLVILSDNPKYPPREEPEDSQDIQIIGRVRCALLRME